jgi:hypothetical protein
VRRGCQPGSGRPIGAISGQRDSKPADHLLPLILGVVPHCTSAHQKRGKRAEKIRRARNRSIVFPLSAIARLTEAVMDGIIYLVGLIVIVMAILSFFGLR